MNYNQKRYSSKSLHWYQWISLWKKVDDESFLHDKMCKKLIFAKHAICLSNSVPIKKLGGLFQAPNMSKYISRNGVATIKASRKTADDNVFVILGQKGHFSQKHLAPWKLPNSVYLYQCFSVWKKVDGESLVHDKVFVLKKHFLLK